MEKTWGLASALLALALAGCAHMPGTSATLEGEKPPVQQELQEEQETPMTATINGTEFALVLEDTPAAQAFCNLLPLEVEMAELNGNEKYVYLDESLPTDPRCPQTIEAGDVMLYGDRCLVVFYESFATSYSYTPIGHLADPEGLAAAAGPGSAMVTFAINE